jgi:putative ABC transport system substrate-binding protein
MMLAAAAAAFPRAALSQTRLPKVALVTGNGSIPVEEMQLGHDLNWSSFLDQLAKKGFVEGRTIAYERFQAVQGVTSDVAQINAGKILAVNPDAIMVFGSNETAVAIMARTKTIPMVVWAGDLLGLGYVTNAARPGGNVSGVSVAASVDFEGKMLSLLAEAVPSAKIFGYAQSGLDGQFRSTAKVYVDSITQSGAKLGLSMVPIVCAPGGGEAEWQKVLATAREKNAEMIVFGTDVPLSNGVQQTILAKLALDAKMPTIVAIGSYAQAGGLLGYGANYPQMARSSVDYVALVLTGAKIGDLPVIQPTAWDFVANLKTAKAIGLTIPSSTLAQASEVIA